MTVQYDIGQEKRSALLFQFCKEAMRHKLDNQVKVIDQDVGSILGYEPADCSHWKRGNKSLRNIFHIRKIADFFNVDESIPASIIAKDMSLAEAIFELKGYGAYEVPYKELQTLKRQYMENTGLQDDGTHVQEVFRVQKDEVKAMAAQVIQKAKITSAPVTLSDVISVFPKIQLRYKKNLNTPVATKKDRGPKKSENSVIYYQEKGEPSYIRYLICKEIFSIIVAEKHAFTKPLNPIPEELHDLHANVFASYVLLPDTFLKAECAQLSVAEDVMKQLARTFDVSQGLINQRLWILNA